MKHNIYFEYQISSPYDRRLELIKSAGFDGIFLKIDENDNNEEIINAARKLGLDIEAFHLSADNCNSLWEETIKGEIYTETIINGIKSASRYQIPIVVMHISSGNYPPAINPIGLVRIKRILEVANRYQVNLALENLRRLDYLDYILDNVNDPYLRFCFDSGHANAFTKNIDSFDFKKYEELLICIHLSDNDGSYDEHQLPFQGNINWPKLMKNLQQANFGGPLTLEAINKDHQITEEEYLKQSKEVLKRLTKLYQEEDKHEKN